MNESRHIREATIRMLEGRIRAMTLRIDELVKAKGPWEDIETLMDAREEFTKILNNVKSKMNSIEAFDLDQHYKRARNAVTEEQMTELRNEFDSYHDSLSESDRELFVLRLSEHAREEIIRTKALIEFVKEIMGIEQETV